MILIDLKLISLTAAGLLCIFLAGRTVNGSGYTVRRFIADCGLACAAFVILMTIGALVFGVPQ
jgi:hypothetical protein